MLILNIDYKQVEHKNYPYRMLKEKSYKTGILHFELDHKYFCLNKQGTLTIKEGYAWNGISCFPDFDCMFEGSLPHDVWYQILQESLLSSQAGFYFFQVRKGADILLYKMWVENGVPKLVAKTGYGAVRTFGKSHALPKGKVN